MMKKTYYLTFLVCLIITLQSCIIYSLFPDRKLMWQTTSNRSGDGRVSTSRAIDAAERYFKSINLTGKTRQEIIDLVGDPKKSNDSMYNFPFYDVEKGTMVYRFDNGQYGLQYNIYFDENGHATRTQHQAIE